MSTQNQNFWDDPRITAHALGELSGDVLADFERELASRPELAAAVQETRSLMTQLETHYSHETVPTLDANRRETILAEPSKSELRESNWFAKHWVSLACAVSLLGVIVGLIYPATHAAREASSRNTGHLAMEVEVESTRELRVRKAKDVATESLRYQTPVDAAAPLAAPASGPQPVSIELQTAMPSTATTASEDKPFGEPSRLLRSVEDMGGRSVMNGMGGGMDMYQRSDEGMGMMGIGDQKFAYEDASVANAPGEVPAVALDFVPESGRRILGRSESKLGEQPVPPLLSESPYGEPVDTGRGPGVGGDKFEPITENAFQRVSEHPLSTFSVDVDTASYSKVRDFLVRANQWPRPDAVRIEELVNYFEYDYAPPAADSDHPFAARAEIVTCPWNDAHRLARIAVKGKVMNRDERPACNLVFLLDTSGSMDAPNKLPLVQSGLQMLLKQLGEKDRVAVVVYAGSAGLVLDSTPASQGKKIRRALTQLAAGGSTNGGAGISLAYATARDHFITEGVNRVILCTDGDFNVGNTGTDSLVRMVENEAKGGVFLTVLGFGMGNYNDSMLEQVSGKGNGNYAFIDTANEAKKVLVEQTSATLVTIAKDVKFQVEFNPSQVAAYRLIGYENRLLAKEDFNDDKKDAGEIGAGHAFTALYEIVPAGIDVDAIAPEVDELKYQRTLKPTEAATHDEMLTVKLRYKAPDSDTSTLVEFPVKNEGKEFEKADDDVRFAAAVAGFGMKLRRSEYAGSWTLADVEQIASGAKNTDRFGLRGEFVELVRKAARLGGEERSAGVNLPAGSGTPPD